ncbi:MAG TPA: ankyrin repeat domain-containing protein [Allosphingosinicella sp.]|uniref:ankyrin repeat domain-containing protein n=1 Tax=Allosphingosinicella sp. TaxID=2823234 RepID=UPI002F27BA81
MAARFGRALVTALALAVAAPVAAQDYSNSYTFIKAVKDRDGTKVESLLSAPGSTVLGAKETGSGNGALHLVTLDRDMNWLSFLLGKGLKVDARNGQGNSALSLAAQLGWVEGAQLLLRQSASVDLANNRGETPLILAVQQRDLPMVRLLLSRGADPKRTDSVAGYSAIDYAKRDNRSVAIVKLLEAPRAANKKMQGPTL